VLTPEEHAFIETLSAQIKSYSSNIGFDMDVMTDSDEDIPFDTKSEAVQPLGRGKQ